MSWFTVAPPSEVVADRRQASAYRSLKYCLPVWSIAMSGSPLVWIGSTTVGVPNVMDVAVAPALLDAPAWAGPISPRPIRTTTTATLDRTGHSRRLRRIDMSLSPFTETGMEAAMGAPAARSCRNERPIRTRGVTCSNVGRMAFQHPRRRRYSAADHGVPVGTDPRGGPARQGVPAGGRPDRRRHRPDGRAELRPPPARGHARRVRRGGTGPVAAGERVGVPGRGRDLRPHHARAAGPGSAGPGLADGRLAADPQPRHRRGQPGDGLAGR